MNENAHMVTTFQYREKKHKCSYTGSVNYGSDSVAVQVLTNLEKIEIKNKVNICSLAQGTC